ncbi:MAG: sigma-70 family RNA polymerase sigma factor [Gemmatimonadales bacterium]
MAWKRDRLTTIVQKLTGLPRDRRTGDERFRDEALPHLDAVARYALSLTRDASDADDLVQETFLRAFRAWERFVPGSECRAWLFTICRNTYLRSSKREQRVTAYEDADLEALGAAAVHASAQQEGLEDVFARKEMMAAIHAAVGELPEVFREAVVLVDLEEQGYSEVARILEIPIGTVRSRLFRGRRLLQERLIEYARDAGFAGHGNANPTRGDRHEEE